MIQSYLREQLADWLPELTWTESYRTNNEDVGTVYYEGGSSPGEYDVPNRSPSYMVYLSSRNWDYVSYAAEVVFERLQELHEVAIPVVYEKDSVPVMSRTFWLWQIRMTGEPNDLGVENGIRDFSINFTARLTEMKEENNYAT